MLYDANVVDMGQGAAMAIEDAVSLATLLPRNTKPVDIPARLQLYEKARRSRVEMILKYTRMNGRDEDGSSAGRGTGEFNARRGLRRANEESSDGHGAFYEPMLRP